MGEQVVGDLRREIMWPAYSSCEMLSRKHQPANDAAVCAVVAWNWPAVSATSSVPPAPTRTHTFEVFVGEGT